ncbi:MAG: hypothetical protein ABRQ37_15620, partial [Candidatus Eremiobacterota bacterium]
MEVNSSNFGKKGGQTYNIANAIRNFLNQMSEGGLNVASAVIKELLQNADDAEATELHVILDERKPPEEIKKIIEAISKETNKNYGFITEPALLVRNNAKFRISTDNSAEQDDFEAICSVAVGHKVNQATAAGRFGIGFNSV